MQRFRGGLVFKAHGLCVSLSYRLESNKEEEEDHGAQDGGDERVYHRDQVAHPHIWKTQRFADVHGTNFWTRRY